MALSCYWNLGLDIYLRIGRAPKNLKFSLPNSCQLKFQNICFSKLLLYIYIYMHINQTLSCFLLIQRRHFNSITKIFEFEKGWIWYTNSFSTLYTISKMWIFFFFFFFLMWKVDTNIHMLHITSFWPVIGVVYLFKWNAII